MSTFTVLNPATEEPVTTLTQASAADADEAILILESRGDIRVVFTDIRMPGSMDGLKLSHAVRDRWPPVHIVATSAHHTVIDELPAGTVFLPKPYSERKIVGALDALIAS